MKRVFVSYAAADSDAALYLVTQLRSRSIDVFFDYERMLSTGRFTRRMANEIEMRDCLLLLQSPEALNSQQVQAEVTYAQKNNVQIQPLTVKPLNIRDTSEFTYLLHTRPLDFTHWRDEPSAIMTINTIDQMLRQTPDPLKITVDTATTLRPVAHLEGHTSWVRSVAFSPDGRLLVSCANDNTLKLWDMRGVEHGQRPQLITSIDAHDASVWDAAFSRDGLTVASCANDSSVALWNIQEIPDIYQLVTFKDHHQPVYALEFSNDNRVLASGAHDDSVHLRDIRDVRQSGRASTMVPLMHTSHVYSVSFSPDDTWLASASRDSTIRLWEIDTENIGQAAWRKPTFLIGHSSWVNAVKFSPIGTILASASHDTTIKLWDTANMSNFATLYGHTEAVNTVAFSPDARLLVSTSKDNTVRLWDIATQQELFSMQGHDRWVNCAAFSPNGRLLVTASGDNTIKIWANQATFIKMQSQHNGNH